MEKKMASMKRSKEDKRKDMGEHAAPTSIAPDYPYGLVIHLDKDETVARYVDHQRQNDPFGKVWQY